MRGDGETLLLIWEIKESKRWRNKERKKEKELKDVAVKKRKGFTKIKENRKKLKTNSESHHSQIKMVYSR